MLLERPGSDRIPSLLGIGRHPSLVDARVRPTALGGTGGEHGGVEYSTLVSERTGTLFWKTSVRALTVYVNGEERDVDLGRGVMGSVFPSAVLDSGVPLILASGRIANAVWGAVGVSPSADGYCECLLFSVWPFPFLPSQRRIHFNALIEHQRCFALSEPRAFETSFA